MVRKVDCNENGCIEFDEFIKMLNLKAQAMFKEKEILDAFKAFDQVFQCFLNVNKNNKLLE